MNIASVKLINSGKKGLLVTYSSPYNCKGTTSMDGLKHTRRFPIHLELENAFKSLRTVLLDVCDYSQENREKDIQDTAVNEIIYNNESFSLKGTKTILDSDKTIPLTPKNITAEDYAEYESATAILDLIYKETKAYMAGEKEISDDQLILRFNEGNAEFDTESFNKLSDIEKRDIATSLLEEMGHIVIHNEELAEEEEPLEGEIIVGTMIEEPEEEDTSLMGYDVLRKEKEIIEVTVVEDKIESTMEVVKDNEDDFDMPAKATKEKSSKKSSLSLVDGPGDSFKIVASEPEKSTAKRVAKG